MVNRCRHNSHLLLLGRPAAGKYSLAILHPLMELNLTMMKLRLRTRVTENDDLNIIANHTETTPLNFSIFHREQKLTRLFFDL